ncbi:hypothetical protein D3C78_602340 [compost metagenome]
MQVGTGTAQDIPLAEQCRHVARHVRQPQRLTAQQQVGNARMGRQFGHSLAVTGQFPVFRRRTLECPQALEQVLGLGIRRRRGCIEPDQLPWQNAPTTELQGQAGEVCGENLGAGIGRQLFVLILRPQAITHSRFQAPRPTGTLGRAGAGDPLGIETGHAAAGIETGHPRQAGIDHDTYTVDGQAGLGDVGGQHHFALPRWRRVDGRPLRRQVELTVQRAEQHIRALAQGIRQLLMDTPDFRLPRQEHQQAAGFIVQRFQNGLHQPWFDELTWLERPAPAHRHRVHAAFAAQDRRIIEQAGQAFTFQGRRHQQDLQWLFVPKQLTTVQAQGQGQVGIETTFVVLIEDQQAHAFERRVFLQAPGEDAFGDHFDTGVRSDLAVQANPVADRFADLFPEFAGEALGRRPRRQPARFKHEDRLPRQPRLIQQCQGHAGGLAGTGRCFEHRFVACRQGVTQRG